MFFKKFPELVISEPDIQAALTHLRSLMYRPNMPITWDKKSLLMRIRDVVPHNVKVDACVQIGPGIYGIIKPFGIDLADYASADNRLQVWIAIRSGGTDPNNICKL